MWNKIFEDKFCRFVFLSLCVFCLNILNKLKGGEEELITSKTKDFKPEPRVVQLLPDTRNHGGLLLAAR